MRSFTGTTLALYIYEGWIKTQCYEKVKLDIIIHMHYCSCR